MRHFHSLKYFHNLFCLFRRPQSNHIFCDPVRERKNSFSKLFACIFLIFSSNNCVVVTAALKRVLISRWPVSTLPELWGREQKRLPVLGWSYLPQSSCNSSEIEWSVRWGISLKVSRAEESEWSNSEPEKKLMLWWTYSSDYDLESLLWSVFAEANKW